MASLVASTYYSFINDAGKVVKNEHENTSIVKAVPPLKSISKNLAVKPVGVIYK